MASRPLTLPRVEAEVGRTKPVRSARDRLASPDERFAERTKPVRLL
ncbi:MAG: hypothetical protein ACYTGV_11200 [Planctomycetota bacterium]